MRLGIIDFGTNTLRLDIFETDEKSYNCIYDFMIPSKIVENTVGKSLSQEGIEHVVQAVEEHQQACRHYRCDRIECFSTASLRYIDNADDVLEQVEFRSGIKIRMISGDEEAHYDFLALKSVIADETGTGCDLGGGSIQLFTFNGNGPTKSKSFPLGSSRVAAKFVKNAIPSNEEVTAIKACVKENLKAESFVPFSKTLFAMGGTAKAIKKICGKLDPKGEEISISGMNRIIEYFTRNPERAEDIITEEAPNRVRTLVPGMAVLTAVMEYMGCEIMDVQTVGVREGFLESVLSGEITNEPNLLDILLGSVQKEKKKSFDISDLL